MIWSQIEAIAESIGALAIVVSLVYLAIQIRQNTQQMHAQANANRLAAFERNIESGNQIRAMMFQDRELCSLSLRGMKNYSKLSSQEKFRFSLLMRNIFSAMQGAYIRHLSISPRPSDFDSTKIMNELLANPGVCEWLETARTDWKPEFAELVYQQLDGRKPVSLMAV